MLPSEKGEGLRNIKNTGRRNYSVLASRQVSIYWLGFYVLILLPSLWENKENLVFSLIVTSMFISEKRGITIYTYPLYYENHFPDFIILHCLSIRVFSYMNSVLKSLQMC